MADDRSDNFRPKLGRIRSRGSARAKSYLGRVLRQVSLAGKRGIGAGTASRGFSGSRIGRGAQVLRRRRAGHNFGPSYRRVVIKTRIVKLKTGGLEAARAHLRYIQRDGVSKENEPGRLYDATHDETDGKAFLERSEDDRHQFRFIVSPEDAVEMADLKPFVRDLMRAMEEDLGTRLDWMAVDHFNTEHPHTHIVLRGRDELGKDLVIARDYIAHGMRRRASEILILELGPQTEQELRRKLSVQVKQDRFTDLDRELVRDAEGGVIWTNVKPATPADRFKHAMRMGRLRHLERQGLAREIEGGVWELSSDLEPTLRRVGERGDIIKTMHRGMKQAGLDVGASPFSIYDPGDKHAGIVTGRIIDRGLHDELNDGHYILVDAADGRVHYVALDPKQDMDDLPKGAIVEVHPAATGPRAADRVIAEIARRNGGLYSPDAHHAFDPRASEQFVRAHVRRLEALRRANVVRRFLDGSWEVTDDFEERLAARVKRQARFPGRVVTLSFLSLEAQIKADGATWFDHQLLAKEPLALRGDRFGAEVTQALRQRQEHLAEQGLAVRQGASWRYQRNLLHLLRRRELAAAGEKIAKGTGLTFVEAQDREQIAGVYTRPVRLASGKFAVIEKLKEFTLVPWRPVLKRRRGKTVGGVMRGSSVSFDLSQPRQIGLG